MPVGLQSLSAPDSDVRVFFRLCALTALPASSEITTMAESRKHAREDATSASSEQLPADSERHVRARLDVPDSAPAASIAAAAAATAGINSRPTSALHRHAVESVLGFCTFRELRTAVRTCREWRAAVVAMAPLQGEEYIFTTGGPECLAPFLQALCASPLRRHVDDLWLTQSHPLSAAQFQLLAERMPQLRALNCSMLAADAAGPLVLPARLQTVNLYWNFDMKAREMPSLRGSIAALAALPELRNLSLGDTAVNDEAAQGLEPLQHCASLRSLRLRWQPHRTDVAALRGLTQLATLSLPYPDRLMEDLLEEPVQLKLQVLGGNQSTIQHDEETDEQLVRLPTLTELVLQVGQQRLGCLRHLPQLRSMNLMWGAWPNPPDNLVAAAHLEDLACCARLEELRLMGPSGDSAPPLLLASTKLCTLLERLPALRTLVLSYMSLDSLGFLSAAPLARSLEELRLSKIHPRLPATELTHLRPLKALRRAWLEKAFDEAGVQEQLAPLKPPSALLPLVWQMAFMS